MSLSALFLTAAAEGAVFFLLMAFSPSEPQNRTFLWYSTSRLVLMAFLLAGAAGTGLLGWGTRRSAERAEKLRAFLTGQGGLLLILGGMIVLPAALLALWAAAFFNSNSLLRAYLSGLLPLAAWLVLVSFQAYSWQKQAGGNTLGEVKSLFKSLGRRAVEIFQNPWGALACGLLLAAPAQFLPAIRYEYPVGYAGLFTFMSEMLAGNHFSLPASVPYYGPGGMPFAYPPFSFYLMGAFIGPLGVSKWDYLRWAPPVFSWLALVPLFFLARKITGSHTKALAALLLAAASPRLFIVHGQSAGMVRALAFLLSLAGLYLFTLWLERRRIRWAALASLCFALTLMTHLSYAVFFAAGLGLLGLVGFNGEKKEGQSFRLKGKIFPLLAAVLTGLGGLALAAPWWVTMIQRYGVKIVDYALHTHNNFGFLSLVQNPALFLDVLNNALYLPLRETPLLIGAALIGLAYCLVRRRWLLPLWFLAMLFVSEGDRYLVVLGSMMAAEALLDLAGAIPFSSAGQETREGRPAFRFAPLIFLLLVLSVNYSDGLKEILSSFHPYLTEDSDALAEWFQTQTPADTTYLMINNSAEEAEWMPYLLQRTPSAASWGAEWNGQYAEQLDLVTGIFACAREASNSCVEEYVSLLHSGYVVFNNKVESAATPKPADWRRVFENRRYSVWKVASSDPR